ncbi:protein ENDOSPERM defective [Sesamum alatum]|uniref:Protein ENDOSPERM defective n=1 Tax=Sesamum alatum TaxID=300844 RepID=A0AAE1YZG5_9LAMI|nr:protein ENDOSPERM defective [Sesamum alatum]
MADQTGEAAAQSMAAPSAPPIPHRRPRVREVSSRFMSPLIQSNSTPIPTPNPSDFPRSKSVHRRQPSKTDENQIPDPNQSFDKSAALVGSTVLRKQHQQRVKHVRENTESKDHQHSDVKIFPRPDTPIATGTDRAVPSRYRQVPNSISRSNSLNSSRNGCSPVTAAARLLQEATSDVEKKLSRTSTSIRDDSDSFSDASSIQGSSSCPNSPLCVPVNKVRSVPDVRSSMPDVDKWLADNYSDKSRKVTGDCARSLNFSSSLKMGVGVTRPPHPSSCIRSGLDARKGRKVSNHQEDLHSLKMLSNHYLQWRFANAKAEASLHAQKQEAERKLCSMGRKISDIRDDVKKKRNELVALQGIKTFTTIVEAQMPYLDEWSDLEEDYSNYLTGTTNALLSSSARLPVSGEVRVDAGQLGEALRAALKVVELISSNIQRFMGKAEEMDISISELARTVGGERARIEECGYLLSKTYSSQAQECSLRGTLMQLHCSNPHQPQRSEATS